MNILSTLTPTETYLLLQGNDARYRDLLRYTFLNLVLKKVLQVEERTVRTSRRRDRSVRSVYVSTGTNFEGYHPEPCEMPFLYFFRKNATMSVLMRHLVRAATEETSERAYRKLVITSNNLSGLLRQNFIQRALGRFAYSDHGRQVRDGIRRYLDEVDREISAMPEKDPQKVIEKMAPLGGNGFLLESYSGQWKKEVDRSLKQEFERKHMYTDSSEAFPAALGWLLFYGTDFSDSFDHHVDSAFDAACSGCGTSDNSGCNSGCSSCGSGCSGCGGCGGS